ncbi:50S ribosomal protein L28 [bacterium]|nr:50S ribosomal protein L28 [bacterium]
MSRICEFTQKASLVGNRVSHANNKTKVRLQANLQDKTIFVPSLGRSIRLRVSTSALRTINKIGVEAYAAKVGLKLG